MARWAAFDSARLREARIAARLTQDELGDRIGTNRHHIAHFEAGRRTPAPATLANLARALNLAPHELTTINPDTPTLKDLRVLAGLEPATAAAQVGVHADLIQKLEAGTRSLTDRLAPALAALYNVTIDELTAAHARDHRD